MIRFTVSIFFILFVLVSASTAIPPNFPVLHSQDSDAVNQSVTVYIDVVVAPISDDDNPVAFDDFRAVTPYTYKSVMFQSSGRNVPCWRCSSPCAAYMCCNDGYPQCCLVNRRCMCCRK